MSKLLRISACLFLIFFSSLLQAQTLGLLPYPTKWQELKHDSLSVIYPEGFDSTATRVASLMLTMASADPITTKGRYKPIQVILQPYTNQSNGYVRLAPYSSEFFLQPYENPFYLGSLPWADLLAIHEYRHVQQVNAVNTGISHVVKVLLGEIAFAGMYGLAVSNWLREGDAVAAETKWTPQGRGRLSRFTLPFYEKSRQHEKWKYYVLRNGTYKQNVPDHYPLGYLMTRYGSQAFGEATWDTIFRLTPRMSPVYDPFSGVVKKFYGHSNRFLYEDALDFYGELWRSQQDETTSYDFVPLSSQAKENAFFDMRYPSVDQSGMIYTSITTFDSIAAIYSIDSAGRRTSIVRQGQQTDACFDVSPQKLVWTELRRDPRWLRKNSNVIVVYDSTTGKKKDIKADKGYYMPSLDASGSLIVALHTDPNGRFALHILDAETGERIQALPNPENLYIAYPAFDSTRQFVTASARNAEGKMCLIEQDIQSGTIRSLTPYSYHVIGRHQQEGPWIFFSANYDQLDQVYALNRKEGITYQISKGNQAHYDPAWDPLSKNLVCAQYANAGHKLVRLPGSPEQWERLPEEAVTQQENENTGRNLLTEDLGERQYEHTSYSPWKNAINYIGVGVVASEPVYQLELRSRNILNTVRVAAGYAYNRNNRAQGPYADVSLGMWYPVISFGYQNTTRRPLNIDSLSFRSILDEFYGAVTVPMSFTPGVYSQTIQFTTQLNTGNRKIRIEDGSVENVSAIYYGKQSILFNNSRKRAYRQPYPSWAQQLVCSYAHDISGTNIEQWYLRTDFALPGIRASNYSLVSANLLIQDVGLNSVRLGSAYSGARGFHIQDGSRNYKVGFTYGFPLMYPDVGLGNVLYVPRIRFQPFFDIAYSNSFEAVSSTMSSAGGEVLIDFYQGLFSLGIRYARLLTGYEGNPNQFELFIPAQLF